MTNPITNGTRIHHMSGWDGTIIRLDIEKTSRVGKNVYDAQKSDSLLMAVAVEGSFDVIPSRKQALARLRKEAVERAIVLGLALKRETYDDISSNHPLFSELVTVVFNSTPAIVLSAPAEVAVRRASEMFNFIITVSDNSHDLKANIAVKNSPELGRLQREMNFNVHDNGFTNNFDEVEICSIELAKALGQLGVISERSLHKSRR